MNTNISAQTASLHLLANNLDKNAIHFRISKNKHKQDVIVKNGFCRRILARTSKTHQAKVEKFINQHVVEVISRADIGHFVQKGEMTRLFDVVHKYNQILSNQQTIIEQLGLKNSFIGALKQIEHAEIKDIAAVPLKPKITDLGNRNPTDFADSYRSKKFSFGHLLKTREIKAYKTDFTELNDGIRIPIGHGEEAGHIFKSTQKENLLGLVSKVCESAAKTLGIEGRPSIETALATLKKNEYNSKNESLHDVYAADQPVGALPSLSEQAGVAPVSTSPTSYWLGHATLFLSIPLKSSTSGKYSNFNVITDPVEGDLAAILYPRQTNYARPTEELPAPNVYLLSHNHVDHYSKETIKKLIQQQPIMIVPFGDGHRYKKLGFQNVQEMNWWDSKNLEFKRGDDTYNMQVSAIPARHWAGQGPCGGHDSTFLGYVIGGHEDGDIMFAGDTARLSEDPTKLAHVTMLKETFPRIKWMFEPGGPDEVRKDMETTHQASVDALWMHMEMFLKPLADSCASKQEFEAKAAEVKTLFMHTMTYKLGNLHLSDTKDSVSRVLDALDADGQDAAKLQSQTHLNALLAQIKRKEEEMLKPELNASEKQKIEANIQRMQIEMRDRGTLSKTDAHNLKVKIARERRKLSESKERLEIEKKVADLTNQINLEQEKLKNGDLKTKAKSKIAKNIERLELKNAAVKEKLLTTTDRLIMKKEIRQLEKDFDAKLKQDFGMKSYEWKVYQELKQFCEGTHLNGENLTCQDLATLLRATTVVPKIGSRLNLAQPKEEQQHKIYDNFLPAKDGA